MFLRNSWYVAAWDREVTRGLLARTLLGEPVVLFRKGNGEAVALEDRCCHRHLPLSMGRLEGDELRCGYHGLLFNSFG
jgi:phenylpropionate dioxygenase-like ring-hydroxylating dioxygenase large terminal subunit